MRSSGFDGWCVVSRYIITVVRVSRSYSFKDYVMKKMFVSGSIAALLAVGLAGCSFSVSVEDDEPAGKAGGASTEVSSGKSSDVEGAGGSVSEDGWGSASFSLFSRSPFNSFWGMLRLSKA